MNEEPREDVALQRVAGFAHSGLIVELFGPAAAGKTTLSRALEAALHARGTPVRLVASARPAEQSASQPRSTLAAPFARTLKVFEALAVLTPGTPVDPPIRKLMEVLPSGTWLRSLRVRRYLVHLCRSWRAARAWDGVTIFDQGFVNLLGSLALLDDTVDRRTFACALALVPAADLLVRLEAPREVLEARLEERLRCQIALERAFENDTAVCRRQMELSATLDDLLSERGRHLMRLSSLDRAGAAAAVDAITREILSRRGGLAA